ncbi:M24 family metallopeptidase [Anaeroselena agilis]|uniref:Xaa-Pro peptidase family protein n=1 Tax=Anaeroselena agilis TaxID=3063788 RepID=A0ABU3P2W4_9FIRM|nr:Xaa-Pro peptidase family protein [Selenomonadales bacterium 4137-cl]
MTAVYRRRIGQAQQMMAEQGLDILFVNNRENLIYFTGLTQIECLAILIPREGEACAVTLWLDADYVSRQSGLTAYGYHFPRETLAAKCIECMRAYGFSAPRVGFERYFVAFGVFDALRQAFSPDNFVNAGDLFYKLRAVKDAEELARMRKAGRIVAAGMAAAVRAVRPGARENEVLAEAEYAMLKAGSDGSPFRPQVVSGERTLLTHPCASDKAIGVGEIVVIHLGAACRGYTAKVCRTVAVGDVPAGRVAVYDLLLRAQEAAIDALRPGVAAGDVDGAARRIVAEAGWEKHYLDYAGYGVGLRQSEFYPVIGKGRTETIEAGMVVDLLLPTVYIPEIGGPRVTDCIYVGERANEILTDYPRQLIRM